MIKNIVFDLGNVMVRFRPGEYLAEHFEASECEALMEAVFASEEWVMLDRGTITVDQAIEKICGRGKVQVRAVKSIFDNIDDILPVIEENRNLPALLKEKGYKLYILSNFHKDAFEKVSRRDAFFTLFDGKIISAHVKLIKPEKEIYRLLLSKYNLVPEQTLFIDDTLKNVEAGEKAGIKGLFLEDAAKLSDKLAGLKLV